MGFIRVIGRVPDGTGTGADRMDESLIEDVTSGTAERGDSDACLTRRPSEDPIIRPSEGPECDGGVTTGRDGGISVAGSGSVSGGTVGTARKRRR